MFPGLLYVEAVGALASWFVVAIVAGSADVRTRQATGLDLPTPRSRTWRIWWSGMAGWSLLVVLFWILAS